VSSANISAGQSVTFSWSSNLTQNDIQQNGGGCQLNKGTPGVGTDINYGGASGSFTYTPSSSATYTLQCYSGGKSGAPLTSKQVLVNVSSNNTPTSISVTYPQNSPTFDFRNGAKDVTMQIQWNEQNGNYPVNILLLKQTGEIVKTIASNVPNTGSYPLAYDASLPSGTYYMRVDVQYPSGQSGQGSAYSGFFSIIQP
jgi:hypothetical protein